MDVEGSEFHDWEVLHNSDDDSGLVKSSNSVESMRDLEGIEADTEGMIQTNYFSISSQNKYANSTMNCDVSEGSVESDNPSWIDPATEIGYLGKEVGEFWPDSSSDHSDGRKFNEFEDKNELGFVRNENIHIGVEGIEEIGTGSENSAKFWSDLGGIGSVAGEFNMFEKNSELGIVGNVNSLDEKEEDKKSSGEGGENEKVVAGPTKSGYEEEKRSLVWWKLPLEFLKYCVFRVRPVYGLSVAAALMGFVILGRRLYKMKRKNRSLELKVTVDDKKVSQFMSRAARLNEAFSVVKRVPVIRPTLPAVGVTPWPVMSLR